MRCGLLFGRFCVCIYGHPWKSMETWTVEYRHMEVDTWIVEYEPMGVRNYGLHLEVATAGGSYWKSNWWVTAISSSLTGGSQPRAVLIGKEIGG